MIEDTKDTKKSKSKSKSIIKPVSFSENNEIDTKILSYLKNNNLAFSSYVKDLIINDMRKLSQKNEIAEAINNLTKAISNGNFSIVNNNKDEEQFKPNSSETVDQEKKNIIGSLLNMSK